MELSKQVISKDIFLINKAKVMLKDLREQGKGVGARYLKPDDIKQSNEWLLRFKNEIIPFVNNEERQQLAGD